MGKLNAPPDKPRCAFCDERPAKHVRAIGSDDFCTLKCAALYGAQKADEARWAEAMNDED